MEKHIKSNWLPWLLVAGMGILLLLNYLGNTINTSAKWLPALVALICPLMMLFMMFGMGHSHHGSGHSHQETGTEGDQQNGCCSSHKAISNHNKEADR